MPAPHSLRDDPGVPLLTEVLDLTPPPLRPAAPATPAAPTASAAPAQAAAAIDLEAQFESVRAEVLKDLLDRVEPLLKTRMRAALETAAARALDDIADSLHAELARMVDEAVQKEMIRLEAKR
ncbi:hypothetical protein PIGHUM_03513 [Pigmentiphaga humi]|uniref:DUF2486 domain-containing protein n=1 Tax=Pigmentiphaga humi TaxID=2478468 RepID=A0A3P4B561_9BURK|nr:hypothetical protein [Pigmentiphaga humi]VCU71429.1 hypothetical protein PIGHUM_03513 [Pigmentiphaga humi]